MSWKKQAVLCCWLTFSLAAPGSATELPVVQGAPLENRGFELVRQQALELAGELPGMKGRHLRLRLLSIAPGGHSRVHDHRNRPAVFYVIQGATTVVYGDGTARRFAAGEMGYANHNTVHWHRNNGAVPVVFVAADLFQPVHP